MEKNMTANCDHCGKEILDECSATVYWCVECRRSDYVLLNAAELKYPYRFDASGNYNLSWGLPENVAKVRAIPKRNTQPTEETTPKTKNCVCWNCGATVND
jgi:hypothetical protein